MSPGRSQPELGDLAARPNQTAERRHLAHDAGVVPGIGARRDERGQLVDADAAARVLELAALFELVDEGDRVDGLALGVEGQSRAVDLGVALAVEVARVEHFADRPDRAGESIIAPRTDSSASRFCGGTGAVGEAWASWAIALSQALRRRP